MKRLGTILPLLLALFSAEIRAQLNVNFSAQNACENSAVHLFYIVSVQNDSIVSYDWDLDNDLQFDDASGKDISHVFSGSGSFSVALRIISINNEVAVERHDITIDPLPIADFSVQEVCMNELIQTVDASLSNGASIRYYKWSFDNANTIIDSINKSPSYFFSTDGTHQIKLELITSAGCKASVFKNVNVNPIPHADFSMANTCLGDSSNFKSLSTINSGTIQQYLWDFNSDQVFVDGSGINSKYAFFSTGNWPVALRVISAKGCVHDTLKSIAIYPRPHAQFTVENTCVNSAINVNNLSFTDFGTLKYNWAFGNNDTSTSFEPNYSYTTDGTYGIQLKVTSVFGCEDSLVKSVEINALPVVSFLSNDVCLNNIMYFTNTTISSDGIKNYYWNFGDGTGTISTSPNHQYTMAGVYSVTLRAETNFSCVDSVKKNIQVIDLPKAHIFPSATALCEGDSALLVGLNLTGKTFIWSNASVNQQIYVKQAGVYELTVFDANNCWDKDSVELTFNEVPKFKNSADTSVTLGTPIGLWVDGFYDFNWKDQQNNIVNQKAEFDLVPFESQQYSVTATNDKGCSATHYINVEVIKDYHLVANDIITPNNDGKNDVWKINYITVYPDCDVIVFNRWGQEVYRSVGGYQNDWGGVAANGFELPDGAYYYVITCAGMQKEITGPLTILRAKE